MFDKLIGRFAAILNRVRGIAEEVINKISQRLKRNYRDRCEEDVEILQKLEKNYEKV